MNRLVHDPPINLRHLHDVFIPTYDVGSRAKLVRSVEHLEECLAEFETFMHDVAQGKIAVRQNYFSGHWQSSIEQPDAWVSATYADKLGPVMDFQKHHKKNHPSMIYHFNFNTAGYIERVDMPLEGFDFDEEGRLRRWHGEYEPYQIGLTKRCSERLAGSRPYFDSSFPMTQPPAFPSMSRLDESSPQNLHPRGLPFS